MKTLIANSSIPATLIRAVVKNMGGWESFKESAQDVVDHGASCGFGNFIYYTDTITFTAKNRKAIAAYAAEQAKDIARALYGRITDDDKKTTIYNALAWYALEEVALAYCDLLEQD